MMYSYRNNRGENKNDVSNSISLADSCDDTLYDNTIVNSTGDVCPVKRQTDHLGGVKVQVYGLNSYGYLQYKSMVKQGDVATFMPQEFQDSLTPQEWMEFWNSRVHGILMKHKRYEWLVRSWIVVGVFMCTAFMSLQDFWLGALLAIMVAGLIVLASSYPKSCKLELSEMCHVWSQERRKNREDGRRLVEARFYQEQGPATKYGRLGLGVIHFLTTP